MTTGPVVGTPALVGRSSTHQAHRKLCMNAAPGTLLQFQYHRTCNWIGNSEAVSEIFKGVSK